MELRQIRDFLTVVEAGSFAAAARVLNVSQPGLGYQIKQLELDLGATLLVRHSRGVELTPAGSLFLADARRIVAAIGEAKARVRDAARVHQASVRIGLSPTPEQLLAPGLATLVVDGRPLHVSFRGGLSARLIQDVRSGQLDAAVCIVAEPVEGLRVAPLYREHLHLIGPPGDTQPVPFADLPAFRLTTGPRDHLPRQCLDAEAARRGLQLDIERELEPGGLRRALVLHGSAWTVASPAMFVHEIEGGELAARRIVEPEIALDVRMICAPGLAPAVEAALVEAVRATLAAHPGAAEAA